MSGEGNTERGGGEQQGGLTIVKEKHLFKAPPAKTSLLGLDRLAAQKRMEQGKQSSVLGECSRKLFKMVGVFWWMPE